uniref:GTP cyclohydrolase I n=1 Tax=Streptosporangium sp. CA-235898 TaxID=3240073 RepID=UPI003F491365
MTSPAAVARITGRIPAEDLARLPEQTPGVLRVHEDPALSLHDHATALLEGLGIDTTETPTKGTGRRFLNALRELTYGLHVNPGRHLEQPIRHTPEGFHTLPALITVTGIPISGVCACHAFPYTGTADIAIRPARGLHALYPPTQKIARFVQDHAARPTNAETLAHVIAESLNHHLPNSDGVATRITITPLCVTLRGARAEGTTTTALRTTGELLDPAHHTTLLTAWSTR